MNLILERALFVVAPPNYGKSTQLRSMFLDRRLGLDGNIPPDRKIPDSFYISNERRIYVRLTSPHENNESPDESMDKAKRKMGTGRWCFAAPFQPDSRNKMPDVVESVKLFIAAFDPERVRVVFLSPNWYGVELKDFISGRDLIAELLNIERVEVACIDARNRTANGLFLADFFDFT